MRILISSLAVALCSTLCVSAALAENYASLVCLYDEPLLIGTDCYNAGTKKAPAWKRNCFSSCRKPRKIIEVNCNPPIDLGECPEKNAVKTNCTSTSYQTEQACKTRSTGADACKACIGTDQANLCVRYEKSVECTAVPTPVSTQPADPLY